MSCSWAELTGLSHPDRARATPSATGTTWCVICCHTRLWNLAFLLWSRGLPSRQSHKGERDVMIQRNLAARPHAVCFPTFGVPLLPRRPVLPLMRLFRAAVLMPVYGAQGGVENVSLAWPIRLQQIKMARSSFLWKPPVQPWNPANVRLRFLLSRALCRRPCGDRVLLSRGIPDRKSSLCLF
jgi:hypothetical protein